MFLHVIYEVFLLYDTPDLDYLIDRLDGRWSFELIVYCKREGLRTEAEHDTMLEVGVAAYIIVDQMAPHTISLIAQQPVEKSVESSARACPPGTLEKDCVACLICLPEQLQMLEPSILPPSSLDLQDCYVVNTNETIPVDTD
jgi:hypothetical protein